MTVAHPMEAIDGDYSRVLRGHAIVEASAGTGKTYTIENLVLQILLDYPEIPISGILIVTFTEKAAGELKERVRTRLEKALLTADPQHAATLSASLEQFDSAAISTIHGFCNGVLNEFPFENARPLQLETGSDGAARARILADIIRNEWPKLPDRPAETGGGAGDEGAQIIAEALGLQQ